MSIRSFSSNGRQYHRVYFPDYIHDSSLSYEAKSILGRCMYISALGCVSLSTISETIVRSEESLRPVINELVENGYAKMSVDYKDKATPLIEYLFFDTNTNKRFDRIDHYHYIDYPRPRDMLTKEERAELSQYLCSDG